jgi:heat shock protein HslJ
MKRLPSVPFCVIIGVLVLLPLVGGCGNAGTQADDSRALEGKTWRATAIAGVTKVQTAKGAATATFSAGQAGGSGSVNSWGASYTTGPGNTIQISALVTTEMAGPQDLMDQEAAYYAALPKAATYKVTETTLSLFDGGGTALVTYEAVPPTPLTGTRWQTVGYHAGTSGDQLTLRDASGAVVVQFTAK